MPPKLQIERSTPIWLQIGDQIRQQILGGELTPGTKLPSTAEMAKQSGTDIKTMHRALSGLVREGIITRARKLGTFVAEKPKKLTKIGLYQSRPANETAHSLFVQILNSELQKQAHEAGITTQIWMDQRPYDDHSTPPHGMEKAIREGQIQGLVTSLSGLAVLPWLTKLPVPISFLGDPIGCTCTVNSDVEDFIDRAVETLHERGCKSVALIMPFLKSAPVFTKYLQKTSACGISTREEWNMFRPEGSDLAECHYEAFGYKHFLQLWSNPEKPDGLIVYPDTIARGVIMALLSANVPVPDSLKVVFHKNEEIDLFCPFPVSYVTFSIKKTAKALLKQLKDAFEGKRVKPVVVKHQHAGH